ncbi:MAG: hypothetical protein KIS96_07750 [Bauldia sp.]|nr:hypothetical protein [Bauldia sp.]
MQSRVVAIFKESSGPISTRFIAQQIMIQRALDTSDRNLTRLMVQRVIATMRRLRHEKLIRRAENIGRYAAWELIR